MKCPTCGMFAMPGDRFCGACGNALADQDASQRAAPSFIGLAAATQASLNAAFLHYRLGLVYYRQGKLEEAIRSWERTLELDPDHAEAQQMLARAQLESKISSRG